MKKGWLILSGMATTLGCNQFILAGRDYGKPEFWIDVAIGAVLHALSGIWVGTVMGSDEATK